MKIAISILLLLMTAVYLLPVKESLGFRSTYCINDIDETKTENADKEKVKDLISFNHAYCIALNPTKPVPVIEYWNAALQLHIVETPPPDFS
ncbi:MAG: hypothetical protein WCJ85_12800 [Chitinophagaceae bacterium]